MPFDLWLPQVPQSVTFATSTHSVPEYEQAAGMGYVQQRFKQNFSCPIPPRENRLRMAIRAGKKLFHAGARGIKRHGARNFPDRSVGISLIFGTDLLQLLARPFHHLAQEGAGKHDLDALV